MWSYLNREFNGFKPTNYFENTINFVFSTWVALKQTAVTNLFATTAINNAQKLSKQNIPMLIMYSRLNMPKHEQSKMHEMFVNHNNMHVLCLEDVIPFESYKHQYTSDLCLLDYLRIDIIKNYKLILQTLRREASDIFTTMLNTNNGNSMMYLDMDIDLISDKMPSIIYTPKGMCSFPNLNILFAQSDHLGKLNDPNSAMQYILSGEAYENARIYYKQKGRSYKPTLANGENCMLCVAYTEIEYFKNCVDDNSLIIDFHCDPACYTFNPNCRDSINSDPLYIVHHTMMYLQLRQHMHHRSDKSWH
ncbi:hypothetical protein [Scale drop disease virus]|uniref:Uncharacterized protein n=1 Tax=Scale drop disease virus TaxID=1697349 RepID=A0A7D5UL52_9VIRU|nr:hypothetical protein [Scale drop disease virus]QXJ13643.1 ORF055R [Scale drop disease virus]